MLLDYFLDMTMASVTLFGVRPLGRLLLVRGFGQPRSFRGEFFLSVGLGVFALEMLMLLLAWWGLLFRLVAITLLVLCLGGTAGQIAVWWHHRSTRRLREQPAQEKDHLGWQKVTLVVALCICGAAYLPGALLPPVSYDALEYHLGAPHLYLQQGRLFRIDGNVYSNFPFNTEMLYTYSLLLRPTGVLAKLFHFSFALLTVVATYSLGCAVGRPLAGLAAALLFLSAPQVAALAISANIDLAVGYYLACSLLALHQWLSKPSRSTLILTAAFVGIAMGCKYIAVLLVALPVATVIAFHSVSSPASKSPNPAEGRAERSPSNLLWFALISVAFLSPWLIKNLVYHGNPVFPLLYEFFGGRAWSAEESQIFRAAHSPTLPQRLGQAAYHLQSAEGLPAIRGALTEFWGALTGSSVVIALLFVPLPRKRLREFPLLRGCTMAAFVGYLGWLLLTNQVGRFLTPLFPLIGVPLGFLCFSGRRKIPIAELALLGLLVMTMQSLISMAVTVQTLHGYDYLIGRISRDEFLERGLPHFVIIRQINELPPEQDPKILMVGEARPFGIRYPVEMSTVFNRCSLIRRLEKTGSGYGLRDALAAEGFTHVFHNEIEVARLTAFYARFGWRDGQEENRIVTRMVAEGILKRVAASYADREGNRAMLYEIQ